MQLNEWIKDYPIGYTKKETSSWLKAIEEAIKNRKEVGDMKWEKTLHKAVDDIEEKAVKTGYITKKDLKKIKKETNEIERDFKWRSKCGRIFSCTTVCPICGEHKTDKNSL